MTLAERIRARLDALKDKGKNAAGLARHVGVKPPSVSKWMDGTTRQLKGTNLMRASEYLECSSNWLDAGLGKMQGTSPQEVAAAIPAGASVVAYDDRRVLDSEAYVFVARYDVSLSAGTGNFVWIEHEEDPIAFRARFFQARGLKPENCRALAVRGRSMEPALEDGDAVMIDISDTRIVDGEMYAVMYQCELFIKYIYRRGGGIRLKSANPEFEPIDIAGEQLEEFRVIGKKVWRAG